MPFPVPGARDNIFAEFCRIWFRLSLTALNCVRLLTRIIPYIHEDNEWKDFFWSSLPSASEHEPTIPLAQSLINAICDLLFCPDFTVTVTRRSGPDKAEELANIDSCEYIWEAGVGFAHSPPRNSQLEQRRTELLKLLLSCFSETMYRPPNRSDEPNKWIAYFTSADNRHALPLFTSLLNTVCSYDPVGLGVPYNHLIFADTTEPLVEVCLQLLIVTLDHDMSLHQSSIMAGSATAVAAAAANNFEEANSLGDNLFINYLSRIHRDEDFHFCLKGITRLLNNPLVQSYLPNSTKRLHCHQELLVFFWKICDYNKKFLYYVLKSSDVLDVLVPILYHLNDSRADQCKWNVNHQINLGHRLYFSQRAWVSCTLACSFCYCCPASETLAYDWINHTRPPCQWISRCSPVRMPTYWLLFFTKLSQLDISAFNRYSIAC